MMNLLENEALLEELQETVDDAEIQEQADEVLEIVDSLAEGDYEQLHDIHGASVIRVYRTDNGFNINNTAWDMTGNGVKTCFNFADYTSGFNAVDEGYDFEAAQQRREAITAKRRASQAVKQEKSLV